MSTSLFDRYLSLLAQYVSFKSISTNPQYKNDICACADWLCNLFSSYGFCTDQWKGYGNPVVYATYHHADNAPTMLIYGHYDVQPAHLDEGWTTDPFVLTKRGSKLYARGATDNKGQTMIHIVSVLDAIEKRTLSYNIIFLLEGDEETGGGDMQGVVCDHINHLNANVVVISDGEMIGNHTPTMTSSFRGGANCTLTIKTANNDMHSGLYGNIAPSATHVLINALSGLYDKNGLIAIPGYYDNSTPVTAADHANAQATPFDIDIIHNTLGIKSIVRYGDYHPVIANGLLPTIQISGIQGGYTGEGYKNIIPATASAKLNFRFGRGQKANQCCSLFEQWINTILPDWVDYTIARSDPYDPITIDIEHAYIRHANNILERVWMKKPIMRWCGGAVPIAGVLQQYLNIPVVLIDMANEDCAMHGVDENIDIQCVKKGLEVSTHLITTPL